MVHPAGTHSAVLHSAKFEWESCLRITKLTQLIKWYILDRKKDSIFDTYLRNYIINYEGGERILLGVRGIIISVLARIEMRICLLYIGLIKGHNKGVVKLYEAFYL